MGRLDPRSFAQRRLVCGERFAGLPLSMNQPNPASDSVRVVLFDAVGTLLIPEPDIAEAYHRAGQRHGSRKSIDELRERFPRARQEEEQRDLITWKGRTDERLERQRWRRIVERVFDDVADVERLWEDLWRHFAQASSWRVVPTARAAAQRLRAAGFRVGWASNFDARLPGIVAARSELAGLGEVFVSSRLGFRKPHLGFFQAIERQLGHPPRQSLLLVGDDSANDYDAARAAGWQAWLTPDADSAELEPSYRSLLASLGIEPWEAR